MTNDDNDNDDKTRMIPSTYFLRPAPRISICTAPPASSHASSPPLACNLACENMFPLLTCYNTIRPFLIVTVHRPDSAASMLRSPEHFAKLY